MARKHIHVLVVDADTHELSELKRYLREWGFRVRSASEADRASELICSYRPDVLLFDVEFEDLTHNILSTPPQSTLHTPPVILMAESRSVERAVEAMKEGARDYLQKPLDFAALRALLAEVKNEIRQWRERKRLRAKLKKKAGYGSFVGNSRAMREVYRQINLLSTKDAPVLIVGESGTGKELVAQAIHKLGSRSKEPFITINAAAIPEDLMESQIFGHEKGAFTGAMRKQLGCFELANNGTLFLDEISEMSPSVQPKLLRVIESNRVRRLGAKRESSVDVRILAATNRDIRTALRENLLRKDLYYRLSVFTIEIPPLRNRGSDIELLVEYFIEHFNQKHECTVQGVTDEAYEFIKNHQWPGNVRELKNIIERGVVLAKGKWIGPMHLPPHFVTSSRENEDHIKLPVGISLAEAEKQVLQKTLHKTGNNKSQTARLLGVDVKTVRSKIKAYKLEKET